MQEYVTDFRRYAQQLFPGYEHTVLGLDAATLELYSEICARVAGCGLPAFIRWFAEIMGARAEPLVPSNALLQLDLEHCVRAYLDEGLPESPGFLLIGVNDDLYETHHYLDLRARPSLDAPVVVFHAPVPDDDPLTLDPSFRQFLVRSAFYRQLISPQPGQWEGAVHGEPREPGQFDEIMAQTGLGRLGLTTDDCRLYWGETCCVSLYCASGGDPGTECALQIGATTEREAARVAEQLLDALRWDGIRVN